jgi:fatty-acyl-CoA synthase
MSTAAPYPDLHHPILMPDLIASVLNRGGSHPVLHLADAAGTISTVSYGEMRDAVSRYAQALQGLGFTQGDTIALLSANRADVLYAFGANSMVGLRGTSMHPLGAVDDHVYVLEDAAISTLVFDGSKYGERAAELRERLPHLRLLSLGPTEVPDVIDLVAESQRYTPAPLVPPRLDPEAVGSLGYTGGSTGRPKGVMSTYRGGMSMTQIQMAEWQWPDRLVHLICTPLSHAGGAFWIPVLLRGGSFVVLPTFTPASWLEAVERFRITSTMIVPAMLYAILDHPDLATRDTSSLESLYYGASPASPSRLAQAVRHFGPILFQFYGQSEAPMTLTVLRKEDHDPDNLERLASCGKPVAWADVALLDDDCNPVAPGQPGEICARGPLLMKGYWNKPAETEEVFKGGWLHTGDVAREDADGFWYIVDRTKDMIVSGGFNVFPREIEDVLTSHPSVASAAVIGVPDDKWGEAVKAVVVAKPGADIDAAELIALVRERKGPVYAPKTVDVVDALPLTAVGKIDKPTLRSRYWGSATRRVN